MIRKDMECHLLAFLRHVMAASSRDSKPQLRDHIVISHPEFEENVAIRVGYGSWPENMVQIHEPAIGPRACTPEEAAQLFVEAMPFIPGEASGSVREGDPGS